MSITKSKTEQKCFECNNDIQINKLVWMELRFYKYKHFRFMHLDCSLKHFERRYQQNIDAKAPQIILNDFVKIIKTIKDKLKEEDENDNIKPI